MEGVASGFCGDVYGARRSQLGGHVQTRLADLKFLDGARGNVGRGRSHSFIGNVHAINLDAGGAAEAASERDRRVTGFGGVEVLTILNLHARLKLGQIKEVATIYRQVGDLI